MERNKKFEAQLGHDPVLTQRSQCLQALKVGFAVVQARRIDGLTIKKFTRQAAPA